MEKILPIAAFVPLGFLLYFGFRRLQNLGMSPWWIIGIFAPVLNFWIGYRCYTCPAGFSYHKKIDNTGVVLAIIYWLLLLAVILIFPEILTVLSKTIHLPEFLEKLHELAAMA